MPHPKQGKIHYRDNFAPGRLNINEPIPLPDFETLAESMIANRKLFQGWKSQSHVLSARQARAMSNVLAHLISTKKVSAQGLTNIINSTLQT
jgi:hypothetical protein